MSFNVNGIRAAEKKGFLQWLQQSSPDILAIQETKAHPSQLSPSLVNPPHYQTYWNSAQRKGYSGVATFTKITPLSVSYDVLEDQSLCKEGRIIQTDFPEFTLLNVYFPNGKQSEERLRFKLYFYDQFLEYVVSLLNQNRRVVIAGDFNTAHKPIDLARPKANEKFSGFLPIERAWMDDLVNAGFIDAFRYFNNEPGQYTWWSLRAKNARKNNVGWRIDYFFVSSNLEQALVSSSIHSHVFLSDHCPIELVLRF